MKSTTFSENSLFLQNCSIALGLYLLQVIWLVHQTSVVHSVNDASLVPMVKDTEGPTI